MGIVGEARLRARTFACAVFFSVLCALLPTLVFAQPVTDPAPLQFQSELEARRFHSLVAELRCVMCQNQSLADSNAQIAVDLRREVLELIRADRSDSEIRDYLVQRYGEFVLYRPRVGAATWLLWFGPAVLLIGGALVVVGLVRRRAPRTDIAADTDQEW
ncbi:cytochrome c-type biogenesis protein [Cognatilysobacter bugurensis]|nr:cytochrome c-type biogenesis protein [Lysobacter bugurensis]